MLERAGFTVKFDFVASVANQVKKTYVGHDFDLSRGGVRVSGGDPHHRLKTSMDAQSNNAAGYADPKMDRLLDRLQAAADDKQRQAALDGIQTLVDETVPLANVGASAAFTGWGKNVQGIVPTGEYMTLFGEAWIGKWCPRHTAEGRANGDARWPAPLPPRHLSSPRTGRRAWRGPRP